MEWLYTTRPWPQAFEVCATPWQLPWTSHDQTTYPSCQTRRRSARLRRHRHQRGSQRRRTSAGFRPARRADGAAMRATRRGARAEAAAEQAERQRQRPRQRQACLRAAPARRAARRRAVWRRSARSLRSPSRASPTASVCTARRTETNRVTNLRTAHASTMTTRFRLSNHTISDGIGTRKGLFDHTMRLQRVMLLLALFLQPACGRGLRSAHGSLRQFKIKSKIICDCQRSRRCHAT